MIGKVSAGAAHTTLNLIEDEQGVMFIGELASLSNEPLRNRINAAFSLDELERDARRVVVYSRFERFTIVPGNKTCSGK